MFVSPRNYARTDLMFSSCTSTNSITKYRSTNTCVSHRLIEPETSGYSVTCFCTYAAVKPSGGIRYLSFSLYSLLPLLPIWHLWKPKGCAHSVYVWCLLPERGLSSFHVRRTTKMCLHVVFRLLFLHLLLWSNRRIKSRYYVLWKLSQSN